MCRCYPSLLILPVMQIVHTLEPVVSVVGKWVVAAIFPFFVQTSSIVFPDFPKWLGQWWSKNGRWGRVSVLDEIVQTLDSPAWLLNYCCKEDECMCRLFTGGYLHEVGVHPQLLSVMVSRFGVVYVLPHSAKLTVNVPELVFPMAWFSMCR